MFVGVYPEALLRSDRCPNGHSVLDIQSIPTADFEIDDIESLTRQLTRIRGRCRGILTLREAEIAHLIPDGAAQEVMHGPPDCLAHHVPQRHFNSCQHLPRKLHRAAGPRGLEQRLIYLGHQSSVRERIATHADARRFLEVALHALRAWRSY